tara:strand:+ start:151 stop:519 length:369 start_codon:yes stop_codon:yes gene_type:complete
MTSCNEGISNTKNQIQDEGQETQIVQQIELQTTTKIVLATYQDATVYAGRTDYTFEDEIGGMLLIEGNSFEREPIIEVPNNMVDPSEELDGLPGGNPALIGKRFKLYYNDDGSIFKLELEEK